MAKRVLFLCNGNSARSQMAEAFLRYVARGQFEAHSAGAYPEREVHPLALETLRKDSVPVDGLTTKDISTFAEQTFDFVISLCDRERERPSIMQGADMIYWTFRDPAEAANADARTRAFQDTFRGLERRIRLLVVVSTRRVDAPRHSASGQAAPSA
jgi:ArsR family transcriptional regulator, arsenate/arsenite/antimonite-responsive transcriptional repressor / arsenate reductase (thioredoxin)